MRLIPVTAALSALVMLPACASILSGTTQKIQIASTPTGADCGLFRKTESEGEPQEIARVNPTPGEVEIKKTKYDITAVCAMPGYEESRSLLESDVDSYTFGNAIAGGGIGWAVDSARGADNKYPAFTNVMMSPLVQAPATTEAAPVTPATAVTAPAAVPATVEKIPVVQETAPQAAAPVSVPNAVTPAVAAPAAASAASKSMLTTPRLDAPNAAPAATAPATVEKLPVVQETAPQTGAPAAAPATTPTTRPNGFVAPAPVFSREEPAPVAPAATLVEPATTPVQAPAAAKLPAKVPFGVHKP